MTRLPTVIHVVCCLPSSVMSLTYADIDDDLHQFDHVTMTRLPSVIHVVCCFPSSFISLTYADIDDALNRCLCQCLIVIIGK